jgi:hypothetical protein
MDGSAMVTTRLSSATMNAATDVTMYVHISGREFLDIRSPPLQVCD